MAGVAGVDGGVAEVFAVGKAELAGSVGAAHPGDADAIAGLEVGRGGGDDLVDDLVAEDEGREFFGEIALDDVEIGAADAAGEDFEEGLTVGGLGNGDGLEGEDRAAGRGVVTIYGGLHGLAAHSVVSGRLKHRSQP